MQPGRELSSFWDTDLKLLASKNVRNKFVFFISHPVYDILFVLLSHSVMSDSLRPHELQHARLPYPSPSPGACTDSCPLNWWCHPTIWSSVITFSSCLQSFPASRSFLMSQLFASRGQSIGASASASVLSMNIQVWSPCCPRDSQESSPTPHFEIISSLALRLLCGPALTCVHDYWKNHSFD